MLWLNTRYLSFVFGLNLRVIFRNQSLFLFCGEKEMMMRMMMPMGSNLRMLWILQRLLLPLREGGGGTGSSSHVQGTSGPASSSQGVQRAFAVTPFNANPVTPRGRQLLDAL